MCMIFNFPKLNIDRKEVAHRLYLFKSHHQLSNEELCDFINIHPNELYSLLQGKASEYLTSRCNDILAKEERDFQKLATVYYTHVNTHIC